MTSNSFEMLLKFIQKCTKGFKQEKKSKMYKGFKQEKKSKMYKGFKQEMKSKMYKGLCTFLNKI